MLSSPLLRLLAFLPVVFLAAAVSAEDWKPADGPLMTRWAKDVSPEKALPEYPRPQLVRKDWQNLNGLWDYALTAAAAQEPPASYAGKILVPFPYEAALSGVGKDSPAKQRLWYRRTFAVPDAWGKNRVLLHFGAVNWESAVFVNGQKVVEHTGGYDGFDCDVTDWLKPGANELAVSVRNPMRVDVPDAQVLGKQRSKSEGIFYTGATGIWQTVWLEPVPAASISGLKLTPDVDGKVLRVTVQAGVTAEVKIAARVGSKEVSAITGRTNEELSLPVESPHLWTPDDPYLYRLQVSLLQDGKLVDGVGSYFAMRKISLGKDEQGRNRIFLNNKFVFQVGTLDQGYWPDGIYTAPTDEALRYDIEITKKLAFNLIRKHAKTEPARWYYWCDQMGMLVWQDMPQMYGKEDQLSAGCKAQFEAEWRRILAQFHNSPCIVVWTTFNEGWGQHDTPSIVELTKRLDPSRLVNNASGWTDKGVGDIHDTHHYPPPWSEVPSATRASVCGEFGGITLSISDHRWLADKTPIMSYGAVLRNGSGVARRYQELLKQAYKLRDERGMSALVYTQITDVEQEINGLLTYDRAVMKPEASIIAAANRGQFPPLPPNAHPDPAPTSEDEPQAWRYTTDKPQANWAEPTFFDTAWKSGEALFGHDIEGTRTQWTTGDIWIRRTAALPAKLPAKLALRVKHDEDTEIYLNGVLAASEAGYKTEYVTLPITDAARATLKAGGRVVIAAHCHQTVGGQGIDVGIVEEQ